MLADLARDQPVNHANIIVVSEHVDYWNRPEWSDPYSSPLLTARQTAYVAKLHVPEPYTPQAVIDGSIELVGSSRAEMLNAIRERSKKSKGSLTASVAATTPGSATIELTTTDRIAGDLVAFAVLRNVDEHVRAGENAGRSLKHVSVANSITEIANWSVSPDHPYQIKVPLNQHSGVSPATRIVIAIQESHAGRVLALAAVDL